MCFRLNVAVNQLKKDEETKEIQEQLKDENKRRKSLENTPVSDHQVVTTVQENVFSRKDRNDELNHEIKSNGKKVACKKKKPEKNVTKKPISYGPRIDLPCCIGSENPCNRPQLVEKWNNRRAAMQVRVTPVWMKWFIVFRFFIAVNREFRVSEFACAEVRRLFDQPTTSAGRGRE